MNLDDVKETLALIQAYAERNDFEVAHSEESNLYHHILVEVSNSNHPLAKIAEEALKSDRIRFSRYYA